MRKLLKVPKLIIKVLLALISLFSKIILQLLIWFLTPLSLFLRKSLDRIHLSITLKLNLFYGTLYICCFVLTYAITLKIYLYYIEAHISSNQMISVLSLLIISMMCISFILFLFLGRFATRSFLSSLKSMDETIKSIDTNKLDSRLNISGTKDELKDLAKTFNSMMDKLEIFINSQKQFVSDASHELRTPIAVIQGYANLLSRWGKDDPAILEESLESIKQETDNMKQLVEKLLFLARTDKNTQHVEKELLNLSNLANEVLKQTSFIDDKHLLKSSIAENIMIWGDSSLTKELLRIFIDNAIKYTPENGCIELVVKTSGKNVILAIKDTGVGIDSEHLPHIFERFYRVDEARHDQHGSSGLGLSIAKWIIDIHEAEVYVNSIINKGTEFIVFYNKPTV
ncbi:MAG: ATP-binding protein [Cellulosilyticaceae bacterium]